MRRVMLNADVVALLRRYLTRLRCPRGVPTMGSDAERAPLIVGFAWTTAGRPMQPGSTRGLVQRVVEQRACEAMASLCLDAQTVSSLEHVGVMLDLAQRLEQTTPHTLRHSLVRRLIES